jgi:quercetin dioxygenase-like cupin family protein
VKRIVCGADKVGMTMVLVDEELLPFSSYSYGEMFMAWASDGTNSSVDMVNTLVGGGLDLKLKPGEVRFLRVDIQPGGSTHMHRTPFVTDYLVGVSGSLTMIAEDGSTAVMGPGDMLVQLGGFHSWRNDGDEPFIMVGVVVGVATDEVYPSGVVIA